MERKRWADPGYLKRCILRSRRRVGWCEFSARLFLRRPWSWRADNPISDLAAVGAQLVGHQHLRREALFLEQLAHQFHRCSLVAPSLREQVENLAFVVNRSPQSELPARNHPVISSRCHREVGRGRLRRGSRANCGPNFKTHRRTVSYETSRPRSASGSSTSR
jgi:hypothetical protein